jgi:peptide/nickel transport system permease protein
MNLRDSLDAFRDFWREFAKVKSGIAGLVLLSCFILLGVFGPSLVPFPGATDHWRDIAFWQDNPRAAPPAWSNWFSSRKGAVSTILRDPTVEEKDLGDGVSLTTFSFAYRADFDRPPRDMVVRFTGQGQVPVTITVTRPDGLSAEIYRDQLSLAEDDVQRVSVDRNCAQGVIEFVRSVDQELASTMRAGTLKPLYILFSKIVAGVGDSPIPLKGDYNLQVAALKVSADFSIGTPEIMVSGDVAGLLGTDISKRDVFTGLIIGIRWALVIGILTSIITVLCGVFFAVTAAYFGGAVDWVLNRVYELLFLMPVLPFLIVISAIFKPTIWTLIIIICLFFWTGPFKPAYSMALQIREETFVEASKGIGSGRWRIIVRHIIPILLPYSFAQMALAIPGVIVYEASVSLLGLGDATIVTWGQLLNDALSQGAVINNLWWWVVPPGLMIALMGMSFAFLGTALDKILHPKLRTR